MKAQGFLGVLTVVNLVLLAVLLVRFPAARTRGDEAVLRGRALEIVDEQGRVRASIMVHPPGRTPDGKPFPTTAILRLIDPAGRPEVKLAASERGAGLGLVGASDQTHAILEAQEGDASLRLETRDGRQQTVRP